MPTLSVARSGDATQQQHSLHAVVASELAACALLFSSGGCEIAHDTYYADGLALYQLKGSDGTSRHDKIQKLQYFTAAELNNFSLRAFSKLKFKAWRALSCVNFMYSLAVTKRYIFAALDATHMTCWYANSVYGRAKYGA
jgi:hypothetical protein